MFVFVFFSAVSVVLSIINSVFCLLGGLLINFDKLSFNIQ